MTLRPPLWLATPSRFAGMKRTQARWTLGLLALLIAAALTALANPGGPPGRISADNPGDVVLYQSIVAGVRGGGDYYAVAAQALRIGDYPMRPFVTFRLPTLAVLQATLPPLAVTAMLYTLVAATMLGWFIRLRPVLPRTPPRAIAMVLLGAGLVAFLQPELASFHEVWAGLLIALSLALRHDDRWVEAVAFGMMAMLIRETAALYVGLMTVIALMEGRRREALGWGVTLLVFAAVIALHAHAVAQVVRPTDPASPGWAGMLGFGFFVQTMAKSTALALAPLWLAAPLVALGLVGWAAWRDGLAARTFATLAAYAVLLGLFGRADTFYWGLMIAPTFLLGLAFVPDALRDLLLAATERRRITITRLVR